MCALLTVNMFSSGSGDSLLITLLSKYRIIIDCRLASDRIKALSPKLYRDGNVVDMLITTHPHDDHVAGLAPLINQLKASGGIIRCFSDTIDNPKQTYNALVGLLQRRELSTSDADIESYLEALRWMWDQIVFKKRCAWVSPDADGRWVEIGHAAKTDFRLMHIAPPAGRRLEVLESIVKRKKPYSALNDISLGSVLEVDGGTSRRFAAGFFGDCDGTAIGDGLAMWQAQSTWTDAFESMGLIKVGHHGSLTSRLPLEILKKLGSNHLRKYAFISVGRDRPALPTKSHLNDLLQTGWTVLLSEKRSSSTIVSRSPDRREPEHVGAELTFDQADMVINPGVDISLILDNQFQVRCGPRSQVLASTELDLY